MAKIKKPKIEFKQVKDPNIYGISNELYRTCQDNTFYFKINDIEYKLFIPAEFLYDGNSVPKFGRMFINRDGVIRTASLIHDALYRTEGGLKHLHLGVVLMSKSIDGKWIHDYICREWCDYLYGFVGDVYTKLKREKKGVKLSEWVVLTFGGKFFGLEMPPAVKKMKIEDRLLLGLYEYCNKGDTI